MAQTEKQTIDGAISVVTFPMFEVQSPIPDVRINARNFLNEELRTEKATRLISTETQRILSQ